MQATNAHNEYGLVEVERRMPFRSPSQDVGQVCLRCNNDYRFMARGVPMQSTRDAPLLAAFGAVREEDSVELQYDKRKLKIALRNINVKRPDSAAGRLMARTAVAVHGACHNCD